MLGIGGSQRPQAGRTLVAGGGLHAHKPRVCDRGLSDYLWATLAPRHETKVTALYDPERNLPPTRRVRTDASSTNSTYSSEYSLKENAMPSRLSPSIGLDLAAAHSDDLLREARERAQAAAIRRHRRSRLFRRKP